MALIVEFPQPVATVSSALDRIRRLSLPLESLFTGLFAIGTAILAIAVVAVLTYGGTRLQVFPGGINIFVETTVPPVRAGWSTVGALPLAQKAALATSASLMVVPALAILWQLRRLFRLYRSGVVLAPANAHCIAVMAVWLIAYAAGPTLGHLLVSVSGFDDRGWLRLDSVQALALGLVLFVIARVMQWGADVQDDASRFV